MKGFLSHYTPSLMNPEDLDAIFVQRQPLLTDLLENIERSVLTEAKHHALLIGPRGIGKTYLISMIYHRVSANETFKNQLKIAWLREEEWGVATFLDLLVRILNALVEEYKDSNLEKKIKDLYGVSTEQAEQLAGHILRQYCQDQTLLLLMENLDEIFKGLDESGQQAFRAYLQNYGFITIVATSQSLFSGVKSRNLPFYGFFSITHLKPLVLEEAVNLLANIAKWRGDKDLADLLMTPLGKSRIRAIHHLAGGNHRIYIIFSQFLTTESLDSLVEPFMKTLDDLTPFYQSRMQFISPQQRKIIEYLCEQRGAIAVKEIAQHCFISQQTASSQLKQLREMGYVYADSQGRESFYELQEPLMRICLEAKKRRGTPNQLFISFLRVWFSREELENRLEILPLEASFDRECILQALAEMEFSDDPKIAVLLREWDDAHVKSNNLKLLEISEELTIICGSSEDWVLKALAYAHNFNFEQAINCVKKSLEINPNNSMAWAAQGAIFQVTKLPDSALISCQKALEINNKNPVVWCLKALVELQMNQQELAKKSIDKALKFAPNDTYTLANAVHIYQELGNQERSLYYIDKLLEIDEHNDKAWLEKAKQLINIDNSNALICANQAVALNPNSSENFYALASIQYSENNMEDALKFIKKSIEINPDNYAYWMLKGVILFKLNRLKSLKCFNKVLILSQKILTLSQDNERSSFVFFVSELFEKVIRIVKVVSIDILYVIFQQGKTVENWKQDGQAVLDIYARYNLLTDLSGGLVESIKAINEPNTSDHTAQAWLEMWQNLAGQYDEFKVALNLLKVAVEYKINRDRRVLFQLPQEERQILEELLNPETV